MISFNTTFLNAWISDAARMGEVVKEPVGSVNLLTCHLIHHMRKVVNKYI